MAFDGLLIYKKKWTDKLALQNTMNVNIGSAGSGSDSTAIMADSAFFGAGNDDFIN